MLSGYLSTIPRLTFTIVLRNPPLAFAASLDYLDACCKGVVWKNKMIISVSILIGVEKLSKMTWDYRVEDMKMMAIT
jgi:hypothetical protein